LEAIAPFLCCLCFGCLTLLALLWLPALDELEILVDSIYRPRAGCESTFTEHFCENFHLLLYFTTGKLPLITYFFR
jgi:hypothetical protein